MIHDPIADFLTCIRNAGGSRKTRALVNASKMNKKLSEILTEEGFIKGFKEVTVGKRKKYCLYLRFEEGDIRKPLIEMLQRVSRPGLRKYFGAKELPRVRSGFGLGIISTSKGLMSDRKARKEGVGGEYICALW